MHIGSLEYVVIGVPDDPFTQIILPEPHTLQGAGHLRVVDLLFVQKHADGTVIKMLTTLLPITTGAARVAGFDITHQAVAVRRVIGYVPQALSADGGGAAGRGTVRDILLDHCLPGENPRSLYGHRPGADDAALLCQQCDLPDRDHANLAASDLTPQSFYDCHSTSRS